MGIDWNQISSQANGGTEYMARQLESRIDSKLLDEFQIIPSRVLNPLKEDKIRILWLHDLPGDPESEKVLANGGWTRFHCLVFVSNWQMQQYVLRYQIPWSRCVVLHNAVDTEAFPKPNTYGRLARVAESFPVKIVYTTTPHRGLDILWSVFEKLAEEENVTLSVFSSFRVYGEAWAPRDEPFKPLFEAIEKHPKAKYYGAVDRDTLYSHVAGSDMFAYPSTWLETSCLCLIESMLLGLDCVHPNYGALFETGANFTSMYQWTEDKSAHASRLYTMLKNSVKMITERSEEWKNRLEWQAQYARTFYSWDSRAKQWKALLEGMLHLPREIEQPVPMFTYSA